MKNLSTGTGFALLATAIVAYPIVNRISSVDQTAHASVPVTAIAAAATAQANPEPTIVWYGTDTVYQSLSAKTWFCSTIWRAWSDGKVEAMVTRREVTGSISGPGIDSWCTESGFCTSGWKVVSSPSQGYAYRSDITADQIVDGADLATMLADWGDAPRYDIPPSDCPLNLINP